MLLICLAFLLNRVSCSQVEDFIPRVVYKTGRYPSEASFPSRLHSTFTQNRKQNPEHQFVYLNDSCLNAALNAHSEVFGVDASDVLGLLRPGAYRADIGRLALLWAKGGIYSDLPQSYTRPLEEIVDHTSRLVVDHVFAADRPTEVNSLQSTALGERNFTQTLYGLQTSFLAAPARSPLILHMLLRALGSVRRREYGLNPLDVTGPVAAYRNVAALLGLTGINPSEWGRQSFVCDLNQINEAVRCRKKQKLATDGSDSAALVVEISVDVRLEHVADTSAGPRLTLLCHERQHEGSTHLELLPRPMQTKGRAESKGRQIIFSDEAHHADKRRAHPRHPQSCLNGSNAVFVFGAPGRTKKEKNALVYLSAAVAKKDHYDYLWKERRVFTG